ncbi:hypothetical protein B0A49_00627 [Cryomyces minteri]|uniref:C2H2-type domain-containing protein n=1 Tax=Cryomyces minteri TaxID=331657 RepID=A0A4U0XZF1_9PEZI|nr:hypothetical protein B0A49_00627 [Cryomyces minteri]
MPHVGDETSETNEPNEPNVQEPAHSSKGLFQCGDCRRSYARLDNLARHVRSHTQEKPYQCKNCSKRFARIWVPPRTLLQKSTVPNTLLPSDLLKRHAAGHGDNADTNKRRKTDKGSPSGLEPAFMEPGTVYPPDFLQGAFQTSLDLDLSSGTWTPRGLMDFGLETNLELNDLDFSFLETYNSQVPFHLADRLDGKPPEDDAAGLNNVAQEAPTTANVLQRSIWRFVPVPHDHGAAEHDHLSLPAAESHLESPESCIVVNRRTGVGKLDHPSRDKILGVVLSIYKPSMSRTFSAFPSVELLDNLLQYFLSSPFSNANTWLHVPSFCPMSKRPELLTAIAAAGAVLAPDPSLRKLGFALQEVVRNYIPIVWEGDNTQIRNLQLSQAFMLQLEIGLWSGNSRKIEIAESFQQPLLTMLRRGGNLRRSNYPVLILQPEDEGQKLHEKWQAWI